MPAQCDLDALLAREQAHEGDEEAWEEHGELKASEARENDEADERSDAPRARSIESADAGGDRRKNQRIRDRLREHERRVEQARQRQCERRCGERLRATEAKGARQRKHRYCGEGHDSRIDRLRRVIAGRDAAEEPRRCGDERREQRCEVRRRTADVRMAGRGDRPAELGVEVLVGEVRGAGML
jgi:hypothetical protein